MDFFKNFSWDRLWLLVWPFLKAVIIMLVGHFIIVYLVKIFGRALSKSKLDTSLAKFLTKTANILLHVIIVLSALNSVGVSTTGLLATLSAAAVGIALALKDSLSNIAGGILLFVSPRFSTGDYIKVGNEEGFVVSVDLMHTTVRTFDCLMSVPNGILINSQIDNYTKDTVRRVDIRIPVPYSADVETVKRILQNKAKENKTVDTAKEQPYALVEGYENSSVTVLLRAWCKVEDYWTTYFSLTEQLRNALADEGIYIPFNQLDVHLKKD